MRDMLTDDPIRSARQQAATDALFASCDRPDSPGCVVGVLQDGELRYARGYGSADLDHETPLGPDSVFYIASVAKQFTAAAIARLAADGALALDDPLRGHLPELPATPYDGVTLRHALHHTSGIRDYLTLRQLSGRSFEDWFDNAWALDMIARQRALNFAPGAEFNYSNSNYVLLAEVVARVAGMTLQAFCQRHFFDPLGMTRSQWGVEPHRVIPGRVTSYAHERDIGYRRMIQNFSAIGDGNLLTTVCDLARWDAAFYDRAATWRPMIERMLARGALNDGTTIAYAGGLGHGTYRELPTVHHGGGMLGFRTFMLRLPTVRFTAIVLANHANENAQARAEQLADIWHFGDAGIRPAAPLTVELPSSVAAAPAALEAIAGVYRAHDADNATVVLERDGVRLSMQFAGTSTELVQSAPDVFHSIDPALPVQVRALPPDDGLRRIELIAPGREIVFDEVGARHSALLDAVVGHYHCEEVDTTWTLECTDGHCYLRGAAPHGATVNVHAVGADELVTSSWRLHVERDAERRVSALIVDAGRACGLRFLLSRRRQRLSAARTGHTRRPPR
jgi:CubicO group peptidase (beta-lactamase class C family)